MGVVPSWASISSLTKTATSLMTPLNMQKWSRNRVNHFPCVEVDGTMLADVSGEEVENYLLSEVWSPKMVRRRCADQRALHR